MARLKGRDQSTPDKLRIGETLKKDEAAHEAIISHYDTMGDFKIPIYNDEADMDRESILRISRAVNIAMSSPKVLSDRLPHVTMTELKEAILSFPDGKASDLSGCSHDFYKYLEDRNLELIRKWINSLFDSNNFVSPELSKSRFSLLFKA